MCKVVGTIVSTVKDSRLLGRKLLICQALNPEGRTLRETTVAVDCTGAGKGDTVLILLGAPAQSAADCPADAAIIAIVDTVKQE